MSADNDYTPRNDDSNTNENDEDIITEEQNESPAEVLGFSEKEYKDNFDDEALHPDDTNGDDAQEDIEDRDKDGGGSTKST